MVAIVAPLFILDVSPSPYCADIQYPTVARCLNRREGEISIVRIARDSSDKEVGFEYRYIWKALKDPKIYVMVLVYLGANSSIYAISFFLPSIIAGLGYTDAQYDILSRCLVTVGLN